MKNFGLEPGMIVADFGCGSGHYSFAAAKIAGKGGIVYAIDVQKELLQLVKNTADLNHIKNIEIIWADLEEQNGSRLAGGLIDVVIISNILFQAGNKDGVVKEAFRVLKDNGTAAVVEWDAIEESIKFGPANEKRITKEECERIFLQEGFKLDKEFVAGDGHYGLIFKKKCQNFK